MKQLTDGVVILPVGTSHKDEAVAPAIPTDAAAVAAAWGGAGALSRSLQDLQRATLSGGPDSLGLWAMHYLNERCVGGSPNTLDAKARDLASFVRWFVEVNGTGLLRAWRVRDTQAYLRALESGWEGRVRAATSVNRAFATLRHFARWAHDKYGVFGAMGLPTADVRELATEEAPCKKLERQDVRALFKAAEDRVVLTDALRADAVGTARADPTRRKRPRRDVAMLALLYYTGLRATELVMLRRDQYDGTHLLNVARKGHNRSRRLYVPVEARRFLEDYLRVERPVDDPRHEAVPLFLATRSGSWMRREYLAAALSRIAEDASKHRPNEGIRLHPHRLRHTFGARHREASGSDTETAAALGHQSLKYVGRYVRQTDREREALIERALDT